MTKIILWACIASLLFVCPAVWAQAEKPAAALTVEAKVCTGVQDRMPVGEAASFPATVDQVYLWTKITGASGEITIKHVWVYNGKEMTTVDLPVKTAAYRTWSAKKILPSWTGKWEVRVVGPDGATLATVPFTIGG
jgi:hypothetical protein